MLVLVAANGICAMSIVWPTSGWVFVPSPAKLIEYLDADEDEMVASELSISSASSRD